MSLSYFIPEYLNMNGQSYPLPNPIIWLAQADLPEQKKIKEFWGRHQNYYQVISAADADIIMIPQFVNHYFSNGQYPLIKRALTEGKRTGKKVVCWVLGDYDYRIKHPNAIVIIQGPDIRDKKVVRLAGPVEIKDHFPGWDHLNEAFLKKEEKPAIGFVGQAGSDKLFLYFLRNMLWHFAFFLCLTSRKPPPLYPHILIRRKAINILQQANGIETEFIVRNRFLGIGASGEQQKQYLQNIRKNPYTLCLRGTGNFSFRFYDTLCMGRIPVFIDTHCVLPFADQINWRDLIVILPVREITRMEEYIHAYHQKLSDETFVERQKELRRIWEKYLEREAYYHQLAIQLKKIAGSINIS